MKKRGDDDFRPFRRSEQGFLHAKNGGKRQAMITSQAIDEILKLFI
jgi:hypothetical protein